jgi:UDP-glucose 4-epimerase
MKGKTVLVTGAAGFIASHVVDELIKAGAKVIAVDDLSGGFRENVHPEAEFIQADITDAQKIESIFSETKPTYVYHLAAYAAEGLSHFIRIYNYRTNLIGTMAVVNASIRHKVKCLVFTSSIAVYGKNQLPMQEDLVPMPEDPYGISKYACELDLKSAHEMFGLQYVIFRPHNVYGERQNLGDKYRNVIGIFMNKMMQGLPIPIFGTGEQQRAFTYIGDIAPIIANSATKESVYGHVFNIGADTPYTVNQLAVAVADALEIKPTIEYQPARNEVHVAYADHEKVKNFFSDMYTYTDLFTGIKKMCIWAKERGIQKPIQFNDIEITEKLPPSWLSQ